MAQSHIFSGTAITAIGLGRGWLETPWPGTGRQQYRKQYPAGSSDGHSAASPPTRCCRCRTRSRDRKRQAPNAKQPRRLGRRPFPPLLFLPAVAEERMPF